MQHPSKSWTLDPVCPLYPSIYYQKKLQEAKKSTPSIKHVYLIVE